MPAHCCLFNISELWTLHICTVTSIFTFIIYCKQHIHTRTVTIYSMLIFIIIIIIVFIQLFPSGLLLKFSTHLKITTWPDPARRILSPNPTQPDTPAWIVCPNLVRTRHPMCLHCFPHTLVMIRSGVRSASAPPHEASSQTYSSPHMNSDDSQQTIYNLQPANVFHKKGRLTCLICVFFQTEPGPNLWVRSGLLGRPDPLRTLTAVLSVNFSQGNFSHKDTYKPYSIRMKKTNYHLCP